MNATVAKIDRRRSGWTVERELVLKQLWEDARGLTAGQIAVELGGFEDLNDGGQMAVANKARRMKLPPKKTAGPCTDPVILEQRRERTRERERKRQQERTRRRREAQGKEPLVRPARTALQAAMAADFSETGEGDVIPVYQSVSLLQLEEHHCRFVVSADDDPAMFCGRKKITGTSWCGPHCRLVFRPRDERGRPIAEDKPVGNSGRRGGRGSVRFGFAEAAE